MNTEAASKKRGRPRRVPATMPTSMGLTPRQSATWMYATTANAALAADPAFAWLLESSGADQGRGRLGILAELGRLEWALGRPAMLEAAEWCCATRPTTKVAIPILRRWRGAGSRSRMPLVDRLQSAIVAAINEACAADPSLTPEAALVAAREALDAIVVHTRVSAA